MSVDPNSMTPEEYSQYVRQKHMAQLMRGDQGGSGGPPPGGPQMAQQFMGGGAGGAGGGGGGGGSAMAGAAPWAALAAAIAVNEGTAAGTDRRPQDPKKHLEVALSGEALERDAGDIEKVIGGGRATRKMGELGNPRGVVRNAGKLAKPWDWEWPF